MDVTLYVNEINVIKLNEWLTNDNARSSIYLLDVREPNEISICHIDGSHFISLSQIPIHLSDLPDDKMIIVYCHHGIRSRQVAHYLLENGFDAKTLFSLKGGIDEWAKIIDNTMMRY